MKNLRLSTILMMCVLVACSGVLVGCEATVPDVIGYTESAAKSRITGANLKVGSISQRYSSTIAVGRVAWQYPPSGRTVDINSSVNFDLSMGPEPTAELILNEDTSSDHIASATLASGTKYDFWVQRDANGDPLYISDIEMSLHDGTNMYAQVDPLGRISFARGQNGHSIRVHFYLEGNRADVTFFDPFGNSHRGILDASLLLQGSPSKSLGGDLLKSNWVTTHSGLVFAPKDATDVACDFVYATSTLYGVHETIVGVITLVGCVGSVIFDAVTFPTLVESIAGCAGSYALGHVVSETIVDGSQYLADLALDCDYDTQHLEGDYAPEDPPTTGDIFLGSGEVHVTLTWDNSTDVDLHITEPGGEVIWYEKPTSMSGGQLDVDNIDGYGPENIFWPESGAPIGTYRVEVVYFDSYERGPSDYYVTVRYGSTVREYSGTLYADGERNLVTTFAHN